MPGQRWTILAVLFAVRAATGFQFQSVGSASSMLMQDLAMDYSQIGMLLGAYLLPGVIVAFPTGVLGQRFRDKTLGLAGLLLMAVSGVMLGASADFTTALVARLIGGVGATIVALVATKMTTDWFDSREIVLAMSILQVSWPFGAMRAEATDRGWPLHAPRWRAGSGRDRRHGVRRDEPRLRLVLQLRAGVDGGAGIVVYRRRVADQPRHLVHDPGHSIGRIPRSPLGQANRSDCRLLADRCRGA